MVCTEEDLFTLSIHLTCTILQFWFELSSHIGSLLFSQVALFLSRMCSLCLFLIVLKAEEAYMLKHLSQLIVLKAEEACMLKTLSQ